MDPANVKFLAQTYTNIRASVCIAGKFDAPFTMNEGVRQGCPASPLVFSLYMDRIEEFLREGCVAGFTAAERSAIRIAGLLIPALLFADDIVFLSRQAHVLQCILDDLSTFCQVNSLTVSMTKTEWMVSGR